MSQEDIETLRSEYHAMSHKDRDGLLRGAHPDFELKTPERGLSLTGLFRGPGRARQAFEEFFGPFEAVTVEPEAFFEGDGRIVVSLAALQT